MANSAKDAVYLGLDIGSTSVGWAVSNEAYQLCRFKGKDMWGVRLFDEANTAAERRLARVQRRRFRRRHQRLMLLDSLFEEEIKAIDPGFFERMLKARLLPEDKEWKHTLFQEPGFTDREYHDQYPTIYHLRNALMTQEGPFDVRLVYLAVHHILKKRGHFLFADLGDGKFPALTDSLREMEQYFFDTLEITMSCSDVTALEQILLDARMRKADKQKRMEALFEAKTKQKKAWIKALSGAKTDLSVLFDDQSLDEAEIKAVEFSKAGYEDGLATLETILGDDRFLLLERWRAVYNWGVLHRLLRGHESISKAKISLYKQNKDDLDELKAVIRRYGTKEQYQRIFHAPDVAANYGHLIGMVRVEGKKRSVKQCTHEEFCKFIEKELNTLEQDERVKALAEKAKECQLLPKLISGDNSVIPYQLHKMELVQILEKASVYLPFLKKEDEEGLTPAQKILLLLEFRIPYYVGPLKEKGDGYENHWMVRREDGIIYPWNFEQKVDLVQSAKAFIDRMTSECTYLRECDVLPMCSPTYERFALLNEINPMTIHGDGVPVPVKQQIVEQLFMTGKKVSMKQLCKFLSTRGYKVAPEDIGGIDVQGGIKSTLKTTAALHRILAERYDDALAEKIVAACTYFGDDRALLKYMLKDELHIDDALLPRLMQLRCAGWGRLSGELLHQVVVPVTGEHAYWSILEALWHTNETLMGLLSDRYGYKDEIEARNKEIDELTMGDFIDELYVSPAVKRQIHQTMTIVKELRKVMGHDPKKIFVEMARGEEKKAGSKPDRKPERKQKLLECYEACKGEAQALALYESLQNTDNQRLRQDKLYLYYTQMGRCMYSGEEITLSDLLSHENMFDIDHIYPQSRVKDDSIDNRVLVKRVLNEQKGNHYPLDPRIQEKMQGDLWSILLSKGLITKRKYDRLTRKTKFTDDELTTFVARQLVETRQSTKAVAQLLQVMMPGSEIVFVKAGLVSEFRHDRDIIKVRELNDLHHAKDAYLNIVVGNVYNTEFTHSPLAYVRAHRDRYTINSKTLFSHHIERGGVVAWNPAENGSIVMVRRMMAKNSVLVTVMPVIYSGMLYDIQPMSKGKGQMPLKKDLSIEKYGGYNKIAGACFMLVEHTVKKQRVRSLIDVPLYLYHNIVKNSDEAIKYCTEVRELQEPRVVIPVIRMKSLISLDGFKMYLTGRTTDCLTIMNANQLMLSYEWEWYAKKIIKIDLEYAEYVKFKRAGEYRINQRDNISKEKNLELYDLLIAKMKAAPYCARMNGQGKTLVEVREKFVALSLIEQCCVLRQILKLFARSGREADLTRVGKAARFGILYPSREVTRCADAVLIHQSPTGLFEKVINLKA